ncbi:MAG: sulfite exporter TauE/SafE family protein [Candidatus Diapherotrites archaeon]|uniref:Sulfite exporter TauE/SafE family protein n=1 Tax=Candidatus Iainarchaeum sp. TaxID=3101447 RepID=A0A8T4L161_9ARCH|nr:sulfite exporter TauE/SafE family protein [Candidatus Diapherotrites archaeon]
MDSKKSILKVSNMVCDSCEKIIEKSVEKIDGVRFVKASYANGTTKVVFDPQMVSEEQVIAAIKEAGYSAENPSKDASSKQSDARPMYILLGLTAIAFLVVGYLMVSSTVGALNISIPQLDAQTSIVLIFLVGLLTGFHCIGMCGGFVLGYTAKARKENPKGLHLSLHSKYAIGKLISYSVIGGIFGAIGSFLVFTPELRAAVAILAGIFLVLFALKLLNIFPVLRKLSLPQGWFDKLRVGPLKNSSGDPLAVGLMNGLFIACGPLQAMYVLAATTGSVFTGALMLLAFAAGTLIPMLGFGVFASFLSHGFQNNIVRFSAVIVLVMGLLMVNNGLALTGNGFSTASIPLLGGSQDLPLDNPPGTGVIVGGPSAGFQEIRMDVLNSGWSPNRFILKKGVPVKWIINGKQINGCNNAITVPEYGLNFSIKPGLQTIEFTPTKTGTVRWSCWMGMIQGTFIVRDDVSVDGAGKVVLDAAAEQQVAQAAAAPPKIGGCGCGGGGSGSCH